MLLFPNITSLKDTAYFFLLFKPISRSYESCKYFNYFKGVDVFCPRRYICFKGIRRGGAYNIAVYDISQFLDGISVI